MRKIWVKLPNGNEREALIDEGGRSVLGTDHIVTGRLCEQWGAGKPIPGRWKLKITGSERRGVSYLVYDVEILEQPREEEKKPELF